MFTDLKKLEQSLYYSIFRILRLVVSVTYRFVPYIVIPPGFRNCAEVHVASEDPCELPASILLMCITNLPRYHLYRKHAAVVLARTDVF